jgi:hypothetical protein
MNLQPSEAEAGLDIRVPPNADVGGLEQLIAEVWAPSSRNMSFEVRSNPYDICEFCQILCVEPYLKLIPSLPYS